MLGGLMRWQAALWLLGGVLGAAVLLARALYGRVMRDLDARFDRIDRMSDELSRVDAELATLRAELPLHYQRRDDAIREYTVINLKLDRLYELLLRE